jgi:hypothetical protein
MQILNIILYVLCPHSLYNNNSNIVALRKTLPSGFDDFVNLFSQDNTHTHTPGRTCGLLLLGVNSCVETFVHFCESLFTTFGSSSNNPVRNVSQPVTFDLR